MHSPAPLLKAALPSLAQELAELLHAAGERDLAAQIQELSIRDRCRCGDSFCATLYTAARPQGSWGTGHETIPLDDSAKGMINLDVVDGRIVEIEVLFRDDIRDALRKLLP
jgi:hypothetical protein